jgi:phospho-N-acetylmuramoyl-pentapeptide-transferase
MGDTGSLFIGGALCGLAFAMDRPLILLVCGLVYLLVMLSVIVQVVYYKLTDGKRIFKMAPIHHHYELCGWSERKIFVVFTAASAVCCVIAWLGT